MKFVQPIRDMENIKSISEYLKEKNLRDYVMFSVGIYSGLRIQDILKLRVSDVRNKDYISIVEMKTNKSAKIRRFVINPHLKKILNEYIADKKDSDVLFPSKQGENKPLKRAQAYNILNEAARNFGIKEGIGTHTMRKTFGYFLYKQTGDIVLLKEIFNHSDIAVTLRYIGMIESEKNKAINKLKFDD
ncbi:MAG TPA: site-specific integrase [Candidatus Nitrosocosmicus sp.]|nr:site-specific integrase [Candidatus Nitrosocosmicus sp.]